MAATSVTGSSNTASDLSIEFSLWWSSMNSTNAQANWIPATPAANGHSNLTSFLKMCQIIGVINFIGLLLL